MIIGVCGDIGSGKDTLASILIDEKSYTKLSFASSLKDAVSVIFGWNRDMLEGLTKESREWRETKDEWWANRLNIPGMTPRWVLQNWGTELFRIHFHQDIWLASVENKINKMDNKNIVITDCRFPNEIETIKRLGGKIICVKRDSCKGGQHASDTAWKNASFDQVIDNNGTLEEFRDKVLKHISIF
jgi:hypothetical protein